MYMHVSHVCMLYANKSPSRPYFSQPYSCITFIYQSVCSHTIANRLFPTGSQKKIWTAFLALPTEKEQTDWAKRRGPVKRTYFPNLVDGMGLRHTANRVLQPFGVFHG